MIKFCLKRMALMVPTLLGIILVVFALLCYIPSAGRNPFQTYGYEDGLEEVFLKAEVEDSFGTRYVRYCYNVFVKGNFNPPGRRTMDLNISLPVRMKQTLRLTFYGFLTTLLVGLPLGICSGIARGKWLDRLISGISMFFSSIPSYCLAIFSIIIFSLGLKLLPVSGTMLPGAYVLPTFVLCVGGVAQLVRMTRSAVAEVLHQPYITALRAKGLGQFRILYVHVMKNSLILIVAAMNNLLVQMLCSTLIVENLFSIPGLGAFLVTAVLGRNLHGVLGCVILIAVILMLMNFAADLLCMAVDPKLRQRISRKD